MSSLHGLLANVPLPKLYEADRDFADDSFSAPEEEVARQLDSSGLARALPPGGSVALAVGSRGIARLPDIVRATSRWFEKGGFKPFIVPAMGSHGNACAEGQTAVLADIGVTPETVGCPVRSSLDVVEIGRLENGLPVYTDALALGADGIFVINRVKPHTAFSAEHESGLVKMLVIGLGNQRGAESCHALGYGQFPAVMPAMARMVLEKAPVIGGLGIVENAFDRPCILRAVTASDFLVQDTALLVAARGRMPSLPVSQLDVLLILRMGKEISGGGVDPNVTGRAVTPYVRAGLDAAKIGVLRLTEASGGNATGMGTCDVITQKLYQAIDFEKTYANVLTSTMLRAAYTPVVMPTDEAAIRCLVKTCNVHGRVPRLAVIRDTLSLARFWVSRPVAEEISSRTDCRVGAAPLPFVFHADGSLAWPQVGPDPL